MTGKPSDNQSDFYLDLDILRYLISIIDEGSLTRAAEKHFLSQPALSRYLSKTEEMLGTDIFVKEHNQLRLTDAGIIFMNSARNMVAIEDECMKKMTSTRSDV